MTYDAIVAEARLLDELEETLEMKKTSMKTKRTRTEYNLERKINAYIRKNKTLYRWLTGDGYDTRSLMQALANEFHLTTPQMSTVKTLVQNACKA